MSRNFAAVMKGC